MTRGHRTRGSAISLKAELEALGHAIGGVRILANAGRHAGFETEQDALLGRHAVPAVLVLLEARLKLLQLAASGDADAAAHVIGDHNCVPDHDADEDTLISVPVPPRTSWRPRRP